MAYTRGYLDGEADARAGYSSVHGGPLPSDGEFERGYRAGYASVK